MPQLILDQNTVATRIAGLVEQLMQNKPLLQQLDRVAMKQRLVELMLKHWSPEEVMAIPEDELRSISQDIMSLEAIPGLLNDLTPEEIEMFDAAVEGR